MVGRHRGHQRCVADLENPDAMADRDGPHTGRIRGDFGGHLGKVCDAAGCAEYSSRTTARPPSWSRTTPAKLTTAPADALATSAS